MKKLFLTVLAMSVLLSLVGCKPEVEEPLTEEEINDLIAGNVDDEPVEDAGLTIIICKSGGTTNPFETVIHEFEKAYQTKVNVISYTESRWDNMLTKLLANDSDFDLFVPIDGDLADTVRMNAYEDLSQYEEISSRISSNSLISSLSEFEDSVVGLPYRLELHYSGDRPAAGTYFKYFHKNVNLFTNEYKDADGEEYFEVLKHLYNNPEDSKDNSYYDFDYHYAHVNYLFLNKYSANKDLAIKFMCTVYDYANKDLTGEYYVDIYPEYEEGIEYYPLWLFWDYQLAEPLGDAMTSVKECDGSEETIRKLAEEAVKGFRMRLEG